MFFDNDKEVETVELTNGEQIDVIYRPDLSHWQLSQQMPPGFSQRARNEDVRASDIAYLEWVVEEHTNTDFMDMANNEPDLLMELTQKVIGVITGEDVFEVDDETSFLDDESMVNIND